MIGKLVKFLLLMMIVRTVLLIKWGILVYSEPKYFDVDVVLETKSHVA